MVGWSAHRQDNFCVHTVGSGVLRKTISAYGHVGQGELGKTLSACASQTRCAAQDNFCVSRKTISA